MAVIGQMMAARSFLRGNDCSERMGGGEVPAAAGRGSEDQAAKFQSFVPFVS